LVSTSRGMRAIRSVSLIAIGAVQEKRRRPINCNDGTAGAAMEGKGRLHEISLS